MKQWVALNAKVTISTAMKMRITEQFELLLAEKIRPQVIKIIEPTPKYNYISDVYIKWRGNSVYLCALYTCPHPDAIAATFESKYARMTLVRGDKFSLAYMRHNNTWLELYPELTVTECLEAIKQQSYFAMC